MRATRKVTENLFAYLVVGFITIHPPLSKYLVTIVPNAFHNLIVYNPSTTFNIHFAKKVA